MRASEPIVLALPNVDSFAENTAAMQLVARCVAAGHCVIAVVGPTMREEKAALAQANALPVHTEEPVHAWVRTEPSRRAALTLSRSLRSCGVGTIVLDAAEVGPTVRGPILDAAPRSVNARAIFSSVDMREVVIVAGGCGRTDDGRPAIVGDGSVLLTAMFLADRLALDLAVLDETEHADSNANFETARAIAVAQFQAFSLDRRAALYARRQSVPFRVVRPDMTLRAIFDPDLATDPPTPEDNQTATFSRIGPCLIRAG